MKNPILLSLLLFSSLLLPAQTCLYLAYEAFDYPAGTPLDDGDLGTGWNAIWTVQNDDITLPGYQTNNGAGSLSYADLQTAGRYARGGNAFLSAGRRLQTADNGPFADYVAPFENGIGTLAGDTLWASLLLRKDENNDESVLVDLHDDGTIPWCMNCADQHIAVGYFGAVSDVAGQRRWTLQVNGAWFPTSAVVVPGVPVFVALRLIFNPGDTRIDLFIDPPTLGDDEPASPTISQNSGTNNIIRSVGVYLGNNAGSGALDELRLAASYRCVAPDSGTPVNLPPLAQIAAGPALTGQIPLEVDFDGSASSDPEGQALIYLWNFGDGSSTAAGAQVSHTYQSFTGTMTASLTVTDPFGLQHTTFVDITALDANGNIPCQTSFTVLSMASCQADDGAIRVNNAPASIALHNSGGASMPLVNGNEFQQLAPGLYTFSAAGGLCKDTFLLHIAVDSSTCTGWQPHPCDMKIGTNMSGIADWSVERPMKNLFKHIRAETLAYTPECFCWAIEGLVDEVEFDEQGYPTHVPQNTSAGANTLVRYVISSESPTGTNLQSGQQYVVLYDGDGAVQINGPVTVTSTTPGRLQFSINTTQANHGLSILSSNINNPVRNIRIVRLANENADLVNDPFYQGFLEKIEPFNALRLMDWGATNSGPPSTWEDRQKTDHFTYAGWRGVPYEVMVQLANQMQKDVWICVPHAADQDYVVQMATLFRDQLDPDLTIYLEYSNEVWNWIFLQAHYNENTRPNHLNYGRAYAEKAKNVFRTWHEVFGQEAGRVKRVLGIQAYNNGLNEQILSQLDQDEWDYGSPSHYFGLDHGNTGVPVLHAGSTAQDVIDNSRHNWEGSLPVLRQDYDQIKLFGKEVVTYEGGQHFVGNSFGIPYPYQQAMWDAQYSQGMYDMYNDVLDTIRAWGCRQAMNFSLAYPQESVFGSWGVLNDIDVQPPYLTTAPKYQALLDNIPDPESCLTSVASPPVPAATMRVYPNPAGDAVQVEIAGLADRHPQVYVTDNLGRLMMMKTIDVTGGIASFSLDTASLPAGLYFIHTNDGGVATVRLVVMR